ncbi:SDR family oxidoreductase [Phytohalomonas tamaricis]|uniref:SDR family oxidoreductase n=1 Tax=Phytohalomonas tamaricis TaxID=2081032 RepID=UPI000D0AFF3D|nr:SDR family oxidoreductase [Phytohalomonas tamaricis]
MALNLKKLHDQTIVITGATTGIGLSTARMAVAGGARVVLAARDEDALRHLVEELAQQGGEATYVVADVGNAEQVHQIARTAIERFGGFDTWVNNAGVSIFGRMLDIPPEDHRRLFETNYWGVVHGSLEAARYFREVRGDFGGVIINLGSLVSDRAIPIQGMYSASKHAVKGFTDALRMELEDEGVPVAVSLIKPSSIATPFAQHAENTMDVQPTLPPPLYEPSVVARSIIHCAETPKRDIFVGAGAKFISALGHCAPRLTDAIMESMMIRQQKTGRQEHRRHFALHEPATDMKEGADYQRHVMKSSIYTEASLRPALKATLFAGAALGIVALARRGSSR